MTYPAYIHDKARQMRVERRMTIDEIAERLAVSRTSVFGWVRDLPFDANTPARSAAQLQAAQANKDRAREKREAAYAQGVGEFDRLAEDPAFRDFVCIYIAEGYKRARGTVAVANSDSAVIKLADRSMRLWTSNPMGYQVQHHADQDPIDLDAYWASELSIPAGTIRFFPKRNSGQLRVRTWRCEYGVMAVGTHDTLFRARLGGWIDCMRRSWL